MTESEATSKLSAENVRTHSVEMAEVDRAVVDRTTGGFVKLVCDKPPHPRRPRALRQRLDPHRDAGPGPAEKNDRRAARGTHLAVPIARRRPRKNSVDVLPGCGQGRLGKLGKKDPEVVAVTQTAHQNLSS